MKRLIDHEYYKKPFDFSPIFIFILYMIIAILMFYYERRIDATNMRITEFDNNLKIERGPEYYKREVLKQ
jgi:hypothetical protein